MQTSVLEYAAGRSRRAGSRDAGVLLGAALVAPSLVGLALLAFRIFYSGRTAYRFLGWDLFLAWVPLGFALAAVGVAGQGKKAGPWAIALGLLWLLFLPNAPYLLTEFIHLTAPHRPRGYVLTGALWADSPRGIVPDWFDLLMIFFYAWNGLVLGLVSVYLMQRQVRRRSGERWGNAVAVTSILLSAFGVSLGRFERWNSWDLFRHPGRLLSDVLDRLLHPLDHLPTLVTPVLLSAFMLIAYATAFAFARFHREVRRFTTETTETTEFTERNRRENLPTI